MAYDPASVEAQDEAGDAVADIILAASASIAAIIAKAAGSVTPDTQYVEVVIGARAAEAQADKVISDARDKAKASARRTFDRMAVGNDEWARPMFEAKGIKQNRVMENKITASIIRNGLEAVEVVLDSILDTSVVGMVQNGRLMSTKDFYLNAVSDAVAASKAGQEAFTASVQRTVKTLSEKGLCVRTGIKVTDKDIPRIKYASERTQEVYSVARQRVMQGYRETMQSMRNQQGEEFDSDGYEVTAHSLCAEDHLPYQGKQYSKKEFEEIQEYLESDHGRPLVTGANCHHMYYPVILGISVPAYSRDQLARMRESSEKTVTFNGLSGKQMTMTRYEASQYQRGVENNARRYATQADLDRVANVSSAQSEKMLAKTKQAYGRICRQAGLAQRPDRMLSNLKADS